MNYQVAEGLGEEQLRAVYELTEAGDYESALANLEQARSSCPANIYIIGLERQLKTLMEFLDAQELGEARRAELIDPMPGLIECAVRELKKTEPTGEPETTNSSNAQWEPDLPETPTVAELPLAEQHESVRNEGAKNDSEEVKLLHFQRASAFVAKGEYERAIAEVRRVFEVDPENAIAQEYIARVECILAQPHRSTFFSVQPAQEIPSVPPVEPDREVEDSHSARTSASRPGQDSRSDATRINSRPPANEDRTASKGMQSVAPPHSVLNQRVWDQVGGEAMVSHSPQRSPTDDGRGSHEARWFSTRIVVITIIMGAIVLAGAAYAAILLTRDRPAGIASRVMKTDPLEDAAISTTSAVTPPVEPSQISSQDVPERTAAESSSSPEKPGPVAPAASVPPPGAQHLKSSSAMPDPGKPKPVQSPMQMPIRRAETKEKTGSAPPAQFPPGISAPHVLAASMPDNKPGGSGVSGAEAAPPSPPAFVPTQKEPQVVRLERPEIPDYIWMSGVVERVVIKVLIDVDGKPIDTQVLMSSKSALEKPVIRAVMNSKFLPGQSAIGPVKTWLTIPFKIATSK
jgi:protein TonB